MDEIWDRPTQQDVRFIKKEEGITIGNASDVSVDVPGIARGKNLHLT